MSLYSISDIKFNTVGDPDGEFLIIWAHGWGHNKNSLAPLAESLSGLGESILVDLPGFGESKEPVNTWGTSEYAELFSSFISQKSNNRKVVWVGHSFGGSVGVALSGSYPELISGLVLIASAGLRTQRSPITKLKVWGRVRVFKLLKRLAQLFRISTDSLYEKFGSADYKQAGSMRQILVRTINEDLGDKASAIECPAALVYGAQDTATPPSVGERYESLISNSTLSVLDDQDHYTLIGSGRHLVAKRIKDLVRGI